MHIKTIITITLLTILPSAGNAQNSISYSYDAAGNRTGRSITVTPVKERNATDMDELNDVPSARVYVTADSNSGTVKVVIVNYSDSDICHITLYDTAGTLLSDFPHAESTTLIDISDKPSGVYILQTVLNDKKDTWKIMMR